MILILIFCAFILVFIIRWLMRRARRPNTIGIFHLHCSSGGGGERVLWHTVKLLLDRYPKLNIYIYTQTGAHEDSLQILIRTKKIFKIDLISDNRSLERLEFIPLSLSTLVESKKYPFLTLFMQNFMSILVAIQAAYYLVPEIYMETVGFTFTLPIFRLFGCTIITYVHYPTISNDMIKNVKTSSHASFNNRELFVKSSILRKMKLLYYRMLASLYGFAGRRADLVMVNSTWTCNHIESLWNTKAHIVYPPCDINSFKSLPLERFQSRPNSLNMISVAQFRPEKNHELQIEAFDSLVGQMPTLEAHLTLYGGCRDKEDQKRVDYLRDLIHRLDLSARVEILVNAPFETLLDGVRKADIAIHTMANEHFGIVLLEFMAAGLITIAHNSGGPKADIIDDGTNGFLANDVGDFSKKLLLVSEMSFEERQQIRRNASKKSDKFSVQVFEDSLIKLVDKFCSDKRAKL